MMREVSTAACRIRAAALLGYNRRYDGHRRGRLVVACLADWAEGFVL
jgi:hypothetical protein